MPSQKTLDRFEEERSKHAAIDWGSGPSTTIMAQTRQAQTEKMVKTMTVERDALIAGLAAHEFTLQRNKPLLDIIARLEKENDYEGIRKVLDTLDRQRPPTGLGTQAERYSAREKLVMRMGWVRTANMPDHIHIVETKGAVHVFGVRNDEGFMLKDDPGLFPSDTLITQLRMVQS